MKEPIIFQQEFLELLLHSPRIPGRFIEIVKSLLPQPYTITDMRLYFDTSLISALQQHGYQYIQSKSTKDAIVVLDLTHGFKEYQNCIDEIAFHYDATTDTINETVIKTIMK